MKNVSNQPTYKKVLEELVTKATKNSEGEGGDWIFTEEDLQEIDGDGGNGNAAEQRRQKLRGIKDIIQFTDGSIY